MITLSSAIARAFGAFGRSIFFSVAAAVGLLAPIHAQETQVDAELVLLVDTSSVVSDQEFSELMEAYAQAFESQTVIDTLQFGDGNGQMHHGTVNGLAVSLVFLGGLANQGFGGVPVAPSVGVPWMRVDDEASLDAFAAQIRSAPRPQSTLTTNIAEGLGFAADQIGSEVGASANGFESELQAINVNTESFLLLSSTPAQDMAARDQVLGNGVDVISGITVGTPEDDARAYYEANIVGGATWGVPGNVVNAPSYAQLPGTMTNALSNQILTIVPEPSTIVLLALSVMGLSLRHRGPRLANAGH